MGGSGIRSGVGVAAGLCSRREAGNLLQRACDAVGLVNCTVGGVWILCGPGIAGDAFRLLYRNTGGLEITIGK
jgi:hypothetical protein